MTNQDLQTKEQIEPNEHQEPDSESMAIDESEDSSEQNAPQDDEFAPLEAKEKKPKWKQFVFAEPFPAMEPFDLHPVTDIVIRNAVDDGVKNKRDLSLYKTTEEWNHYPPGMVIIASEVAEGQPFAVWDPPKRKKREKAKENKQTEQEDREIQEENQKESEQSYPNDESQTPESNENQT